MPSTVSWKKSAAISAGRDRAFFTRFFFRTGLAALRAASSRPMSRRAMMPAPAAARISSSDVGILRQVADQLAVFFIAGADIGEGMQDFDADVFFPEQAEILDQARHGRRGPDHRERLQGGDLLLRFALFDHGMQVGNRELIADHGRGPDRGQADVQVRIVNLPGEVRRNTSSS